MPIWHLSSLSWVNRGNAILDCALGPEAPAALRLKWKQRVSAALACLHEAGIVWGDAKTANILVDMDDNVWIQPGNACCYHIII